ncbi:CsbD family protein [Hymenobacter sp. RP-2-7]|uniref:CsbD family protein n=1 Tax=Hymenobacter polaris TaxID=2682546 RepID=A0A7Y0ABK3_9BACT|nr:CsbD family protein [Hymenobacter polaris]NML64376.1 CsbD family protein [Hymenobacter polaris]
MAYKEDNSAGKVLLAALAGAGAGIIAGILLAPDKGSVTLDSWKESAKDLGDQLGEQYKKYSADLEEKFKGISGKVDELTSNLQIKGNWDEIKGKLKQQYAQLTDEDLNFSDGKIDELLGRLEQKLGQSKSDIVKLLSDFSSKAKDAVSKATDTAKDAANKA